jgi:hypothetical protein
MPLIEEITTALPFVAELSEREQHFVAMVMSIAVKNAEEHATMTKEERDRLSKLDTDASWRRLGRR